MEVFNKYFIWSMILALLLLAFSTIKYLFYETLAFILTVYFIYMLILVIVESFIELMKTSPNERCQNLSGEEK